MYDLFRKLGNVQFRAYNGHVADGSPAKWQMSNVYYFPGWQYSNRSNAASYLE